jgi:aspartyl-tRNA synthetase
MLTSAGQSLDVDHHPLRPDRITMDSYLQEHDRTLRCGELREHHIGDDVTLFGWVDGNRDLGGMVFIDLRDRAGVVQVRFDPEHDDIHGAASDLKNEECVAIEGVVEDRGDNRNDEMPTGAVEIAARGLHTFSPSETTPFPIRDDIDANEANRLKHRYLDLRRPKLQETIQTRSQVTHAVRDYLSDHGFLDIETPYLTRSTPEGARDYLVPSRNSPGRFYALPQSPQLFKQLLMVSGFDRYYQIVRCFRDEDIRADRQPEFTQIDLEMSFTTAEQVMNLCEGLVRKVFDEVIDYQVPDPIERLTYDEAMLRYGVDDPDLRYNLEITDISDEVADAEFRVFSGAVDSGGCVRGICVPGGADEFSRSDIDELEEFVGVYGAKGLAWVKVDSDEGWTGPISRFFDDDTVDAVDHAMEAEPGDLLLFVADDERTVCDSLGHLREELAERLDLVDPDDYAFCWITDFPLVGYNEQEDRYDSLHHPFTAPRADDVDSLEDAPLEARSEAYDLVCNGYELAGGSIRIHRPDVQWRVFDLLDIDEEEAREKFGFLLDALEYGAPPHGGIAFGLARFVMLLCGADRIRDVIPFPKTHRGNDLMVDAPGEVDDEQLNELHLKLDIDDED